MAPVHTPQLTVGDLPTRMHPNEVRMYSRDLDAAIVALGIAPPIIEIAEDPVLEEEISEAIEKLEVVAPQQVADPQQELPSKREQILYTVVSGDTLGGIAHKLLGSAKYASNIASLNNIDDPRTIQLGLTLRIPELTTAISKTLVLEPVIATNTTIHAIQDGETLSDIASDYLGSPHKWLEIWEANKSRLPNPNVLKVGTSIVIP